MIFDKRINVDMKKFLTSFSFLFLIIFHLGICQPDVSGIEAYIDKAMKDWDVPGMSVAIVKDGQIISNRGYGVREIGKNAKVNEKTLFAIASNTKAFVSSAIGVLHQEGKLNLNDKVQEYIPGFQVYDSYASSEANIADLLCHRIGLGTYSGDVIWYKSDLNAAEVVEKIRYVPQKYSFRDGYGYSNLMFITAGEVIRKVTNLPWDNYVKATFFNPLGMDRTITSIRDLERMGNFAIPHKPVSDQNIPIDWVNWDNMGAAGGIISSSNDMAKWLIFQLDNGIWENDTILDPAAQNVLWTPHSNYTINLSSKKRNPGTNFSGYGLGWSVSDYYGNRMITHGGGYDGMYSQVAMLPEQKLGIVILTNTMKGIATPLRYYIINQFINRESKDFSQDALDKSSEKSSVELEIEAQKKVRVLNTEPTLDMAKYAGTYQTDMHGPIHIVKEGDDLFLNFEKAPDLTARLEHWHFDTWEIKWYNVHAWFDFGTIRFHCDSHMEITGFEFDVPNNDIFFHELTVTKVK
jgi:CubicO group peptidase (beta-lactamase class C family)